MSTSQLGQDEDGPPVRSAPEVHRSGFLCGHILDIAERSGSLLLHTPTPNNAETLAANKIVLSFTSAVMRSRYCRFTKCSAPHTHTPAVSQHASLTHPLVLANELEYGDLVVLGGLVL